MKIMQLTERQLAALPTVRDAWLGHGLATGRADRVEAEAGVRDAYRAAGLEPPRMVIWLDSPMAGAIAAWMLTTARAQVGDQVWAQVRDQVWAQVRAQVRDQVRAQVYKAVPGQHDAGWLAFYDYFRTHCTLTDTNRLTGMMRIARSAGWWWPFQNAVILTERPTLLHRDGQARLHCETGPALAYPDDFTIWAWHGTRVPRDLIETHWTLKQIFDEPNAEIRRCAIERIGWDQFIQDSGIKKVASCPDPGNAPYHLALYDLPDNLGDLYEEPARILLAVNGTEERDGTRRRFGLPVPAHHTDPVEAAAEMYGWPAEAYRQMQVRR